MERKLFVRLFLPMVFPTLVFAMDMGEMKKQLEDMIQERRLVENNFAAAIAQAVEQTMNRAIEDARFQPLQKLQSSHTDRRDQTTDQMQTGSRYMGNSVSSYNGPHTVALLGSR